MTEPKQVKVLLIDDDRALLRALRAGLEARGLEVVTAITGSAGVSQAALTQPDVVVLDLGLPDADGVEVCQRLRSFTTIPILVLSAFDDVTRRVAALDAGADDFVGKPFSMAELEARIRALLRRATVPEASAASELTVGPLQVDLAHQMVRLHGETLKLTKKEYRFLALLARHAGKICSHEMVLTEVWGEGYQQDAQYLWVYAYRIRAKLGDAAAMLVTHAGLGYELDAARYQPAAP